jgi:hypothetical protein
MQREHARINDASGLRLPLEIVGAAAEEYVDAAAHV